MKKTLLLAILLSQFVIVFAQKNWGPWKGIDCFKGIQFRVNKDSYNEYAKKWQWSIEIKNNYNKKVTVSYKLTTPEDGEKKTNSRTTIEVGGVSTGDWSLLATNGNRIQIYVDKVCFHHPSGFDQCSEYDQKGYASFADCDNGTPKYEVYNGTRSGSSNTSNSNSTNTNNGEQSITDINEEIRDLQRRQAVACSKLQQQGQPFNSRLCAEGFNGGLAQTDADSRKWVVQLRSQVRELESATNTSSGNTNTPQNDLTEYNRSKAEMEQKVREENERRQQQATQLNNQNQQFLNVYNEGVQLGNTAKYAEASAKYQQAIGLATNDADRQTAQNAYNKISKANQQTQTNSEVTKVVVGVAQIIEDARAKSKIEKEEKIKSKLRYYDLNDDELFEAFIADVVSEFKKKGYKLEKIGKEQKSEQDQTNRLKYRDIHLDFNGFYLQLSWYYSNEFGERKNIDIFCKNEMVSKDMEKIKVLDKWATKKSKAEYMKFISTTDGGFWSSDISNIEFDRSTTKDLSTLVKETEELRNFKKEQSISETATFKNLGAQAPIQTSKLPESDVSIKSIIDKYINAIGGYENIKSVLNVTQTDKTQNSINKNTKGLGRILSESKQNGTVAKTVFNGTSGYSEFNGKKTPLTELEILQYKKTQPFEILELELSTLQLGKIETINGNDCYTVVAPEIRKVINEFVEYSQQITYYFEKETGLWRGQKIAMKGEKINSIAYFYLNDYRRQDKILFPFSRIFFIPGNLNSITEYNAIEIKINEVKSDSDFN